jgi:hypothetical protein
MEPLESKRFHVVGRKDITRVHAAGTESFEEARKDEGCAVIIKDTASKPDKEYSLDSDGVAHVLESAV